MRAISSLIDFNENLYKAESNGRVQRSFNSSTRRIPWKFVMEMSALRRRRKTFYAVST